MEELQVAKQAAQEAGRLIRSYYQKGYQTFYKESYQDGGEVKVNPLTEADLKSNETLQKILRGAFPEYAWLSEETKDSEERFHKARTWIVDPLDGTKEFISGIPEFTISIGLAEEGVPIVGVVYNPATEELFWASKGNGAFCNGQRLQCSRQERLQEARLIASRSEHEKRKTLRFKPLVSDIIPSGSSAYKLGMLAQARGDLYVSQHPLSEWDLCAGHLILQEAGGTLLDFQGAEIQYNRRQVGTGSGILAGNEILVKKMLQRLSEGL